MAATDSPAPVAATWRDKARILLYAPNVTDFLRVAIFAAAVLLAGPKHPRVFCALYLLCFTLDAVDGFLARQLDQVSAFGAFFDVLLDCCARAVMWAVAVPGPLGALLPCVEWAVFVSTHAQGGAAWKTGCFAGAPQWVSAVMANGFRSPVGALVMAGLHFLPLWIWLRRHEPEFFLAQLWIGALLAVGRAYCLAVELWTFSRHLDSILTSDCVMHKKAK